MALLRLSFISVLSIGSWLLIAPNLVKAELEFPEPTGYVNDLEDIIDNDSELEQKLVEYEKETTNEIVVVTVADFQDTTIDDFAVKLFEQWGIGKEDRDNGILIVVSASQRESRIEIGYGLEGALTDAESGSIQDNAMIPSFQEGDYSTGIRQGVDAVIEAIDGEYTAEGYDKNDEVTGSIASWAAPVGFFGFILFQAIAFSKSWWLGGVIGFITGFWLGGFPLAIGLMLGGLLLDLILSKFFGSSTVGRAIARTAMSSGGFGTFGGRGSGGGGFGGFGGGGSGGGGSSRGW